MSRADEVLTARGTPNNILTRACWHVTYRTLYCVVTVVAACTRKDKVEVVTAMKNRVEKRHANLK